MAFMERAQLQGGEVPAFLEVMAELERVANPAPLPPMPEKEEMGETGQ